METSQTPSPTANIDAKREERQKAKKYTDTSNWGGFFKSVLKRFLWTLVFALIACNFIYLTSLKDETLDYLFPTKFSEYFPRGYHPYAQAGGDYENCQAIKRGPRTMTRIGYEWPYNMVGPLKSEWDLLQSYKNWVAVTCADSWRTSRGILKDYFKFWGPPGFFSYAPLQILVGAPLTILLSFVTFIIGGIGAFVFALQNNPGWTIIGMFLMFTWFVCGMIALMQFLKFLHALLFLPVMIDKEGVRNILSCNIRFIVVFFGFLVCGSAFDYLDPTIGLMMGIGFLAMTARAFLQETLELIGYA